MRRTIALAAAALTLCAAAAGPAHAASVSERTWLNFCGGNLPGITTCASVKLKVVDNLVTLSIQNLSGNYGSASNFIFTSISFFNGPGGAQAPGVVGGQVLSMEGPYRTSNVTNPPPWWQVSNTNGQGGILGLDFESRTPNGIHGGIASSCDNTLPTGKKQNFWMTPTCGSGDVTDNGSDPGWVVMTFNMTGFWDLDLTNTQFQLHGQSGPGDVSIKCTSGVNCFAMPDATAPEPATLTLVGTGLAGLVGAYRRRRRRESEEGDGAPAPS